MTSATDTIASLLAAGDEYTLEELTVRSGLCPEDVRAAISDLKGCGRIRQYVGPVMRTIYTEAYAEAE